MKARVRLPALRPTDAVEREYYRNLLRYTRLYRKLVTQALKDELPLIRQKAQENIPEELRHDSASVALIGVFAGGKILLQRRRDTGRWTLPGGHLNAGESPRSAAARELREETGIQADEQSLERVALITGPTVMHVFRLNMDHDHAHGKLDPDQEADLFSWVDVTHGLPSSYPLHHKNTKPFDALGIPSQRMDALSDDLSAIFTRVQNSLERQMPKSILRRWAQAMTKQVNQHAKDNTARIVEAGTKGEPRPAVIEPLLKDRELNPYFSQVVDQNVALIKSITDDSSEKIKKIILHGISQDRPSKDLAPLIEKALGTTKTRAAGIARDQVGKLNGALNRYRQQQIGLKRYTWRTMKDNAVRGKPGGLYPKAEPSHWKLQGKIFSWDKPPVAGPNGERCNPGEAPFCRCYAEPYFEDILD